jgi:ribosomal protein L13
MIQNFQNKYGKPEETIFIIGDYDKGDYNMKRKEPVICKKFRRIFRNAVQNMLNIIKSVLNTGKQPDIFCREIHS